MAACPTSASINVVKGPIRAPARDPGGAVEAENGATTASGSSSTSTSITVEAGSTIVTPASM